MSRYPERIPSNDHIDHFAGRNNGYRRRRIWAIPGSYSLNIPDDAPMDVRGYCRVKAVVIGAGSACTTGPSGNQMAPGAGGGLAIYDGIKARPGDTVVVSVGAAGILGAVTDIGTRRGGNTILTVAGITLTAYGGETSLANTGGIATGGQVNSKGGNGSPIRGTYSYGIAGSGGGDGGSSGTPWGDSTGPGWRNPFFTAPPVANMAQTILTERLNGFWDIEDIVSNEAVYTGAFYDTLSVLVPPILGGAGPGIGLPQGGGETGLNYRAGAGAGGSFRRNSAGDPTGKFWDAGDGFAAIWF